MMSSKYSSQMPSTLGRGVPKTPFQLQFPLKVLNKGGTLPAYIFGSPLQLNSQATNLGKGPGTYSMSNSTFGRVHPLGIKSADVSAPGQSQGEEEAKVYIPDQPQREMNQRTWGQWFFTGYNPFNWKNMTNTTSFITARMPHSYRNIFSAYKTINDELLKLKATSQSANISEQDKKAIEDRIARLEEARNNILDMKKGMEEYAYLSALQQKMYNKAHTGMEPGYRSYLWAAEGRKREIENIFRTKYNLDLSRDVLSVNTDIHNYTPQLAEKMTRDIVMGAINPAAVGKQPPAGTLEAELSNRAAARAVTLAQDPNAPEFGFRPDQVILEKGQQGVSITDNDYTQRYIRGLVEGHILPQEMRQKYYEIAQQPQDLRFTGEGKSFTDYATFTNLAARDVPRSPQEIMNGLSQFLDLSNKANIAAYDSVLGESGAVPQEQLQGFLDAVEPHTTNLQNALATGLTTLAALETGYYRQGGKPLDEETRKARIQDIQTQLSQVLKSVGVDIPPEQISASRLTDADFVTKLLQANVSVMQQQAANLPGGVALAERIKQQGNSAIQGLLKDRVYTTASGTRALRIPEGNVADINDLATAGDAYAQQLKSNPILKPFAPGTAPDAEPAKQDIDVTPDPNELPVDQNWWRKHMGFYSDAQYDVLRQVYKDPVLRAKYNLAGRLGHLSQLEQDLEQAVQNVVASGGYGSKQYMRLKNRLEATRGMLADSISRAQKDAFRMQKVREQLQRENPDKPVDEAEVQQRFVQLDMAEDWQRAQEQAERNRRLLANAPPPSGTVIDARGDMPYDGIREPKYYYDPNRGRVMYAYDPARGRPNSQITPLDGQTVRPQMSRVQQAEKLIGDIERDWKLHPEILKSKAQNWERFKATYSGPITPEHEQLLSPDAYRQKIKQRYVDKITAAGFDPETASTWAEEVMQGKLVPETVSLHMPKEPEPVPQSPPVHPNWTDEAVAARWKQRWMERFYKENMGQDPELFSQHLDEVIAGRMTPRTVLPPAQQANETWRNTRSPQADVGLNKNIAYKPREVPAPTDVQKPQFGSRQLGMSSLLPPRNIQTPTPGALGQPASSSNAMPFDPSVGRYHGEPQKTGPIFKNVAGKQ